MPRIPVITLTTDFGHKDPLGAIMKGVILGINPGVNIVDITHDVRKYNVREAGLIIGMCYKEFPPRTIHVVVVDPGVGSSRRPVLVATEDHYFVGPDNGVFSIIYNESKRFHVFHITADHYFRPDKSATFHGRDIFAPVAAWLAKGLDSANFGNEITDFVRLRIPAPSMPTKTALEGEVIYLDTFGNAVTNIRASDLDSLRNLKPDGNLRLLAKGKEVCLKEFYSQAEDKGLYALIDSMGYLELFVYRGNASKEFDLKVGDTVGIVVS